MKKSRIIRREFIDFFESKGHKQVKSSPVVPIDDPTLLFTNAGMNQFKDIFLGRKQPEFARVVDSQKCIRAGGKHNDLEEVGRDGYHHTFFEMLGNWSFADYYKREAIAWAWELLTEVWGLPKAKLYATVHDSDEEAFQLWQEVTDIDPTHIEYHGDKDNFWEMGNTGPCGPCSEIHYDCGAETCHKADDPQHQCAVNGDCHRYIEIWNLVFMQFYREEDGSLQPLKNRYVDTGAGFERICQVLQNKTSNYETDLFTPIIAKIAEISGVQYFADERGVSHRVIADHIRALAFALADGGMPSNEGRGYVLRRILRRAARHGRLLNMKKPFLQQLVEVVAEIMGDHFLELREKKAHIKLIIQAEEERFNTTLDRGLERFNEIVQQVSGSEIEGKAAFMLYDTFGFPLDLTSVMAEEQGLKVDIAGFEREMQQQKNRARQAGKFQMSDTEIDWISYREETATKFVGYEQLQAEVKIQKYNVDDDNNLRLVLDKTPFYAESGGQVGDSGILENSEAQIRIDDVQKQADRFIHIGKLLSGEVNQQPFTAKVDAERRRNIGRNHTVTHLLHKALGEVLGEHVEQKGSLVHPDYLRFDFTHFQQVSAVELRLVEKIVNKEIRACHPVQTEIKSLEKARQAGAKALFGEKYEADVRVVSLGDFSMELCGGTHIKCSGEIGFFKIVSEASIAAGIRRIEAVTAAKAENYVDTLDDEIEQFVEILHTPRSAVLERVQKLLAENKQLQQEIEKLQSKSAGAQVDAIIKNAREIAGVQVIAAALKISDGKALRAMADQLRDKMGSGLGVLVAEASGKVSVVAIVSQDLTKKYQAGKIVNQVAEIVGGRGGGRPDMAMAGGKDISKIAAAVEAVPEIIRNY
ncbi:MAG: alanine--tRNA ligase [Candidatus Cloacimonadales bacterium]